MKRYLLVSVLGLSLTSLATAQTIYQVDLRGHTSLLSNDRPIQRGRLALFHRYPDGVFFSIPENEIVRVATTVTEALVPTAWGLGAAPSVRSLSRRRSSDPT